MLRRIERTVWPLAILVWLYLGLHAAHRVGEDFPAIYRGAYDLIHRLAPYPTTSSFNAWTASTGQPFFVHPPSSPIVLSPLGVLSEKHAGAVFLLVSVAVFFAGLFLLARRTPFPALIMLGAGLALPVREAIGLGNADLLSAGLFALAIATFGTRRAVCTCLALAVKPTAWALVIVLGVPGLIGLGGAIVLNAVGLLVVKDSGRFFHDVIPYLAHGQVAIKSVRTSLPDAASSLGLPHSDTSVLTGLLLIAVLGWLVWKRSAIGDMTRCAPLVVLVVLLLSAYSYPQYAVYLIAVLPLLEPSDRDLPLLGVALYLLCVQDVWSSSGFPHRLNTLLLYKVLLGLLLLLPIAARPVIKVIRGEVPMRASATA